MDNRILHRSSLSRHIAGIPTMWIAACLLCLAACACKGRPEPSWRTILMTTELVPDSAVYRFYDSMHSSAGVWPALEKANRAAGIEEVRIWRFDNRLAMLIRLPADADPATTDSLYLSADSSIAEWGRMMSNLQRSLPGVDSTRKWVEMQTIHHYLDGRYLK